MSQNNKIDKAVFTGAEYEKHAAFWSEFVEKINDGGFKFIQNSGIRGEQRLVETHLHELNSDSNNVLLELGDNSEIKSFIVLLTALSIVLNKYSGDSNTIVATPCFKTDQDKMRVSQDVPLHCVVNQDDTMNSLLLRIKKTAQASYSFQNYPLEMAQAGKLNFEAPTNVMIRNKNLHHPATQEHKFDLIIDVALETYNKLSFTYNTTTFDKQFIASFSAHFENVIAALKEATNEVKDMSILSKDELNSIIENAKGSELVNEDSIVKLFKDQVEGNPDAPALISNEYELSYRQLHERANKIAFYLVNNCAIQKEEVVAIMLKRSNKVVESIMGILMSGAAFLQIDPMLPEDRKAFMLKESGCKVLITDSELMFDVPFFDGHIFAYDIQMTEILADSEVKVDIATDYSAYIIYTSGSTGNPKGVVVEHGSLANLALDQKHLLKITTSDRVLQFAPFTFDASLWEIFNALLSGAGLVIVDGEMVNDPKSLVSFMKEKEVTIAGLSASFYNVIDREDLEFLRVIMTGGERPSVAKSTYHSKFCERYNAYGPTECTVNATTYKITESDSTGQSIPIGKPISNMSVYIMNNNMELVPAGYAGEICVAGIGVARGYLNNEDLVQDKFVVNAYTEEKLYRTGDLGRILPDGNIEFIGRKDNQVKVRGFRIELEEVQNAILFYSDVEEAVVLAVEENNKTYSLAAYIKSPVDIDLKALKSFLLGILPAYMLPSYFVFISKFPLTFNGKIDKASLLSYDRDSGQRKAYKAPRNETEKYLEYTFCKVLNREKVSVNDNFFEIGGNSLMAVEVFKIINDKYPDALKITDIFVHGEIESIASFIDLKINGDSGEDTDASKKEGFTRVKI